MTMYPNVSAMWLAGIVRSALVGCKLKLYKAPCQHLGSDTVIGSFTECDYSGYTEKVIASFLPVYLDPKGGAAIQSGTQQFQYVPPKANPIGNTVMGYYLITASGVLVFAGSFDSPTAMVSEGDAIPVNVILNYGKN